MKKKKKTVEEKMAYCLQQHGYQAAADLIASGDWKIKPDGSGPIDVG